MFLCEKIYRLSSALHKSRFIFLSIIADYINRVVFSCWIPGFVTAGNNLVLGYGGLGIVIHGNCKLGNNVHVDQNVTLGGNCTECGVPKVEDNVYIGTGAKIIGPINIGNNVVIGANSVVINDIQDGSVVAGVPAKLIKNNIKLDEFLYHLKSN